MSRFFAKGGESSSDSDSPEEIKEIPRKHGFNYSSDEEIKRIVKNPKEKYDTEVKGIIQFILNMKKINDFHNLLSKFEEFTKCYTKAEHLLSKEDIMPRFVIGFLIELQKYVNIVWDSKDDTKKLTKLSYKALSTLRQKLRKFCKSFEGDINSYLMNDIQNISDEGICDDLTDTLKMKAESFSSGNISSESSDSGDDVDNIRDIFLKKSQIRTSASKKKGRKEKLKEKDRAKLDDESDSGEWKTVKKGTSISKNTPILFNSNDEITVDSVLNKYKELMHSKSHRRSEKRTRVELLRELLELVSLHKLGIGIDIKIRLSEMYSIFELNVSAIEPMKIENWKRLLLLAQGVTSMLAQNSDQILVDNIEDDDKEELIKAPFKIKGSLAALTERIVDEFYKILKQTDQFSSDYTKSLKDEPVVVEIIDNALKFMENTENVDELCRLKQCKIESSYYKMDKSLFEINSDKLFEAFDKHCLYVYNHDETQRLRTRAILAQVYHKALHDQWYKARDLMLMSNLQHSIQHADISTQILYNRAMAQLGLCAFRHGFIVESLNCLSDLITAGCVRELLGQGFTIQRNIERNLEHEQRVKMNQVPFHMSIHVELLECVYLISAMLINIPMLAAHELGAKRCPISKGYYQVLRAHQKQCLSGHPETMREFVVAASKALKAAKFQDCVDFLFNPKMKLKVWHLISQPTPFEDNIVAEIKKQSLRCYMFAYAIPGYDSISLKKLASMFVMTETEVQGILGAMVVENEIQGSLQLHTNTFVLKKNVRQNHLQTLSLLLADKLTTLLDVGERGIATPRYPRFTRAGD